MTIKVRSLAELKMQHVYKGDQIKLRIELGEDEKHEWTKRRREAVEWLTAEGVEVHGVELILKKSTRRIVADDKPQQKHTPEDAVVRFVKDEELGAAALDMALEIIE